MDALILGAAPEPQEDDYYRDLLGRAAFVIAADAAAEWAIGLGRKPDVAVGDFDSARPGAPERLEALSVPVLRHPVDKDESDLDLALVVARSRRCSRVAFAAVTSGRLDHTLAALGTLASSADLGGSLNEPSLAAWALEGGVSAPLALRGRPGSLVSVFAVGAPAEGVTLRGFRFPLEDALVPPLSSLGLSNETGDGVGTVSLTSGRVLVICQGTPGVRASAV